MSRLERFSVVLPDSNVRADIPELICGVEAGFPSPADDYMERTLDLNEYLIKNQAASFFVRVAGESMRDAGILPGDMLLVDRSLIPGNGQVVVALVNNEMAVKRLSRTRQGVFLVSDNSEYRPLQITEDIEALVWGVVVAVIRKLV